MEGVASVESRLTHPQELNACHVDGAASEEEGMASKPIGVCGGVIAALHAYGTREQPDLALDPIVPLAARTGMVAMSTAALKSSQRLLVAPCCGVCASSP